MAHPTRTIILGAGGRDFHVFNTTFRDDPARRVVAFTAAQIPNIDHRSYPPRLAGEFYPDGIPIVPEDELERVISEHGVTDAVFAYSDVTHEHISRMSARVTAAGATLRPFDPDATMLASQKPVVAVCAVRTGCGKSAVSRHIARLLGRSGLRVAAVRHPMPYGRLASQIVQRFESVEDLARHHCTIEEMEEYEPYVAAGIVCFAGVDYAEILAAAEAEADVVLWDGGNNDTPFYRPDLMITLLDPLRPGDELTYFPSRWNLENADVLVMSKSDQARDEDLAAVRGNVVQHNPRATLIDGRLAIGIADEAALRGKRVLVVEDGPTITHGGMGYGAGLLAAERAGAAEIVDPRPYARGQIADAFASYPHVRDVLPALGYGDAEIADLAATIDRVDCDVVVIGTPIDLSRVLAIRKPVVRVSYEFEELGAPVLPDLLRERLKR